MTLPRRNEEDSPPPSSSFCGLAPVIGLHPAVLILGSYPGLTSLSRGEYYAQSRNRFWAVMEAVLDIGADLSYRQRLRALKARHVALWDVIGTCERDKSSDGSITGAVPNDIAGLLDAHPSISLIALNGSTGAGKWLDILLPDLRGRDGLTVQVLPSTSAANARYRLTGLVKAWQVIVRYLPGGDN